MILSDVEIIKRLSHKTAAKRLWITPILSPKDQFQPSSIDVRLGTEFVTIRSARMDFLDILKESSEAEKEAVQYVDRVRVLPPESFYLHPGEFALASTLEFFKLPRDLAGRLDGKSTWGRVGLQIHSTAGFVDPGFEGALTFELQNVGKVPIPLFPGMRVAQISFFECRPSAVPYLKKRSTSYGGSPSLLPSRYYQMPDARVMRMLKKMLKPESTAQG